MNIPVALSKVKSPRLTSQQKDALIEVYQSNPYPALLQKKLLSQSLKLSKTRIEAWFSARRRNDRLDGKVLPLPSQSWRIRCGKRVFTGQQLQVISQEYARNPYPSRSERTQLSQTLNVSIVHVVRWFQVRRCRDRKLGLLPCQSEVKTERIFSRSQVDYLIKEVTRNPYPTLATRKNMSKEFGVSLSKLDKWIAIYRLTNANEQPGPAGEDADPIDLSKKLDTKFGALDEDSGDSSSAESSMESDYNVPEQDESSSSLPGPQECSSFIPIQEEDDGQHLTGANCHFPCPSVPPPLIPVQPATHHIPFNHMSVTMHSNTWVPSWNQPPRICQFTNFHPMMLPPSPYQYQFNQFNQFAAQNVPNTHRFCPMNFNSFNHSFASNSMPHFPVPSSRFNQFPFQ